MLLTTNPTTESTRPYRQSDDINIPHLSDLDEFRGKQELYTRQSPQRLKMLREHALAASARFITVRAADTARYMSALVSDWDTAIDQRWAPAVILLAAFNLDFLCVHPFRDGNGRVSRLLWLLQSYRLGYEVGRYISLERLVEQNKDRYYETLEQSSQGWHEGRHDPWPFINYVLSIFKSAYREFEERVGQISAPRGSKRELVLASIARLTAMPGKGFAISALEQSCPGVSRDMVRRVPAVSADAQPRSGTLIWTAKAPLAGSRIHKRGTLRRRASCDSRNCASSRQCEF